MADKDMLISVVIPLYNSQEFIEETIKSILLQTYSHWEIVVVDDGSTDGSVELIKKLSLEIRIFSQQNQGCAAACTRGMKVARGDIIQILGADDILYPQKFSKQIDVFAENPSVDIVYCAAEKFYAGPGRRMLFRKPKRQPRQGVQGAGLIKSILKKNTISAITPLIKKEWYERVGYYDPRLTNLEDWNAYLRMAQLGGTFYYLDEILAGIRKHTRNKSDNSETMNSARELVLRNFFNDYGEHFSDKMVKNAYSYCHLESARLFYANGRYSSYRKHYLEAVKLNPALLAQTGMVGRLAKSYFRSGQ